MAFASPFIYFAIHGKFGDTGGTEIERWQVGFKIPTGATAPSPAALTAFLESMSAPVVAFHTNADVSAGNVCIYDALTAAHVGANGLYTGGGSQVTTERPASALTAGAGVAAFPLQIACVYSLRTAVLRGPGSAGRFYYPCLSRSYTPLSGLWQQEATDGAATAAATLIQAINDAAATQLDTDAGVCVMSQVGAGRSEQVEKVLAGRRPDTQRRRAKSIGEAYEEAIVSGALAARAARFNRPLE